MQLFFALRLIQQAFKWMNVADLIISKGFRHPSHRPFIPVKSTTKKCQHNNIITTMIIILKQ